MIQIPDKQNSNSHTSALSIASLRKHNRGIRRSDPFHDGVVLMREERRIKNIYLTCRLSTLDLRNQFLKFFLYIATIRTVIFNKDKEADKPSAVHKSTGR